MSEMMPVRSRGGDAGSDHTVWVDPTRDLDRVRRRWEVRTAQWRATALAESIFGAPVRVGVTGGDPSGRGAFRGLLRLRVPFRDLELHRWRERVFAACAARDPVLTRVPLVYVFEPESEGALP